MTKLSERLHYEVGKHHCINLLEQPITNWEAPCTLFDPWRNEMHELRIFKKRVSKIQVRSFNEDNVKFRLFNLDNILLFFHCMGKEFKWDDTYYAYHLDLSEERAIPPISLTNAKVRATLIDAGSGIVKAVRMFSLDAQFTKALHNAIAAQAELPPIDWEYAFKIKCEYLSNIFNLPFIERKRVSPHPQRSGVCKESAAI